MSKVVDHVLNEALKLAPEDRARVAAELLATLPPDPPDERSDAEWLQEIERRANAALAGRPGLSWSEVKDRVEQRLRGR